ncbi:hypothetical protein PUN28_002911 [Cardiocondyla obscurior]|uniref:Uncharacterized protein n=1 Tax=Cardiocondyla obscurior TaxID=286306 RepID=A0AAW2GX01_9HYME
MFKRQFWHPADLGAPPSSTVVVRAPPPLWSAVPPFWDPYVPPSPSLRGGLPRLLLTDRTKLASPVPPKPRHWNCTNTLRDSGDGGVALCGRFARSIGSSCTRC